MHSAALPDGKGFDLKGGDFSTLKIGALTADCEQGGRLHCSWAWF